MSLPIVALASAVAIHAPGAEPVQIAAAVEGCNQALGEGSCKAAPDSNETEWLAVITWSDDDQRRAHVQLTRAGETADSEFVTRDVEFGSDDPREQRFRAVGLIVAAYVIASGGTARPPRAPPETVPTPSQPPPEKERPAPRQAVEDASGAPSVWGLDGALVVGSAFQGGSPRYGVAFKPWWRPPDVPVLALGQLRWSRSNGAVESTWMAGSLGVAVPIESRGSPLGLEIRGEAVAEHVGLRAEDAASGRSEGADRWRLGARTGTDVFLRVARSWRVFLGADINVLRPRLLIDVAGEPAGREAWLSVQGLAGIRFQARGARGSSRTSSVAPGGDE